MTRTFHIAHVPQGDVLSPREQAAVATLRKFVRAGAVNKEALYDELCGCGGTCRACEGRRAIKRRIDAKARRLGIHVNARGQDDDRRQLIADLISDDASPFTPDDELALAAMSDTALRRVAERYLNTHSAEAETLRRRNNSYVHTLLVRQADGSYVRACDLPLLAGELHANQGEEFEDADDVHARMQREREARYAQIKARAGAKEVSPYTPDDEEAIRAADDEEAIRAAGDDVHAEMERQRKQKLAETRARNKKSRVRTP